MTADKEEQLLSNLFHMKSPTEKRMRGGESIDEGRQGGKKRTVDSVMFILLFISSR